MMIDMEAVGRFLDWLYEVCPIWPDEAPRARLLAMYQDYVEQDVSDV